MYLRLSLCVYMFLLIKYPCQHSIECSVNDACKHMANCQKAKARSIGKVCYTNFGV
jgi:hypothetical protein